MPADTIFLSHSGKDIDKVRKIRDVLETLGYEPLLFHMKCLDDDNDTLEDFIKKEIDARNIFVYCKSKNAEASVWVQKEVSYILENSGRRLYEIDIERPFGETLVSFLHTLAEILKKNRVFISCSHADHPIGDMVSATLRNRGYDVIRYNSYDEDNYLRHDRDIKSVSQNGIFIPIITKNFLNSIYCMSEIEKALYYAENCDIVYKPIYYAIPQSIAEQLLPSSACRYEGCVLKREGLSNDGEVIRLLQFLTEDNRRY